jgi:hypothetical protein
MDIAARTVIWRPNIIVFPETFLSGTMLLEMTNFARHSPWRLPRHHCRIFGPAFLLCGAIGEANNDGKAENAIGEHPLGRGS